MHEVIHECLVVPETIQYHPSMNANSFVAIICSSPSVYGHIYCMIYLSEYSSVRLFVCQSVHLSESP